MFNPMKRYRPERRISTRIFSVESQFLSLGKLRAYKLRDRWIPVPLPPPDLPSSLRSSRWVERRRDIRRDLIRRRLDRIRRKMRIPRRRLNLRMTEQLTDHRQSLA